VSTRILNDIVVVDTDVASFLFKGDTRSSLYEPHLDGRLAMIAAQTKGELELWTLIRNWGGHRRAALRGYLKSFVFAEADETICLHWAEVQESAQRKGRPISCADTWIAATALAFEAPLITNNPADFKDIPGLTVITEK
jgi:tRNA(fMet)-specific endonuclease VapC